MAARGIDPLAGYRFAVMGDQRALADGEWQALLARIEAEDAQGPVPLAFLLDTGDIVQDGRHADQFARLRGILDAGPRLPYLVSVGNHEVAGNRPGPAREHVARFLSASDPSLAANRLYFAQIVGSVRFLFLDTNDLVYGDRGEGREGTQLGLRGRAQMAWLVDELARPPAGVRATIAVMHHPILSTSSMHRGQAIGLWGMTYEGRTLPDILADGGVDVIFTGHTHTYERFLLRRSDGRSLRLVNISGRPRESILWFGAYDRRARAIRGRENAWLREHGFPRLDDWEIRQEDVMTGGGSNQYGIVTVESGGGLVMDVRFLDPARSGGSRDGAGGSVRLR